MVKIKLANNNNKDYFIKGVASEIANSLNKNKNKYIQFIEDSEYIGEKEFGKKWFHADSIISFCDFDKIDNTFESF